MNEGKKSKFFFNKEKMSPDIHEKTIIDESKESMERLRSQLIEKERENAGEFSLDMIKFIAVVKKWHEERFRKLGIHTEINWGEVIKMKEAKTPHGFTADNYYGISRIGDLTKETIAPSSDPRRQYILLPVAEGVVRNMDNERAAEEVVKYIEALNIAHELYHDSAPQGLRIAITTDKETGEKIISAPGGILDRQGMDYQRKREGAVPTLEEGLAMTAQEEAEELAASMFPQGAYAYRKLLEYGYEALCKNNPDFKNIPINTISVLNFDGKTLQYGTTPYQDGKHLVQMLKATIPNFMQLVEEGRINGNTLPLARAVEKKFGRGAYRKIVTAEKGWEVIQELAGNQRK